MLISEVVFQYQKQLETLYDVDESRSIIEWLMQHVLKFSKAQLHAHYADEVNAATKVVLDAHLLRLLNYEPVQYVVGETAFYGMNFRVNKHVLIPRPETEELVDLIVNELKGSNHSSNELSILDIGTGSGCIAISLKKNVKSCTVYALDISDNVLHIAKQNALLNNLKIEFIKDSILMPASEILNSLKLDVIVSNPPYVRKSEAALMHNNVLQHEPHLALFVNDDDALLFYRHITDFAKLHLKQNGKLYFEINEAKGEQVQKLLVENGFNSVKIINDFSGKARMVSALKF